MFASQLMQPEHAWEGIEHRGGLESQLFYQRKFSAVSTYLSLEYSSHFSSWYNLPLYCLYRESNYDRTNVSRCSRMNTAQSHAHPLQSHRNENIGLNAT